MNKHIKIPSRFKCFVTNKYAEYKDECETVNQPTLSSAEYFQTYKWFLKSKFKEEQNGKF